MKKEEVAEKMPKYKKDKRYEEAKSKFPEKDIKKFGHGLSNPSHNQVMRFMTKTK